MADHAKQQRPYLSELPLSAGRPGAPLPNRSAPVPPPAARKLRGYAFDPSLSIRLDTMSINEIVYKVPWEADLKVGPVGEYLEVVDYDPPSACFYEPVDLNQPNLLAQDGLAPSQGNPQFHQQMVYAVAMTTIHNFEQALGRKVLWRSHTDQGDDDTQQETFVQRLRIYPHAMREANAFYNPDKKALVFGYFNSTSYQPGTHLAGGIVFTCLSHDIVAHETTHAVLDGIQRRFIEPTHPDALAFHEAFSDIVALFQHFSFPEVLRQQIAKTRGNLASQNLLGQLAQEFGVAIGNYDTLRDAIGRVDPKSGQWQPLIPDPQDYLTIAEPHARGSILVAAVFDAFTAIYKARVADLLRIASGGSGVLASGALHPDLVNRLAMEAAKAAQHVLLMCIRALDYCPPVNLTFGDYLRALITADADIVPNDDRGYRVAFIEAFRRRGIYPHDVRNLAIESLGWPSAGDEEVEFFEGLAQKVGYVLDRKRLFTDRRSIFMEIDKYRHKLIEFIGSSEHRRNGKKDLAGLEALTGLALVKKTQPADLMPGHDPRYLLDVSGVFPVQRVGPDGDILNQLLVSITQVRKVPLDPAQKDSPSIFFRGGCTLILDLDTQRLCYRIVKSIQDEERLEQQRRYMLESASGSLRAVYLAPFAQDSVSQPFALLHRSF
jgi:hypothetical protein